MSLSVSNASTSATFTAGVSSSKDSTLAGFSLCSLAALCSSKQAEQGWQAVLNIKTFYVNNMYASCSKGIIKVKHQIAGGLVAIQLVAIQLVAIQLVTTVSAVSTAGKAAKGIKHLLLSRWQVLACCSVDAEDGCCDYHGADGTAACGVSVAAGM
jgi:hypothetical protein